VGPTVLFDKSFLQSLSVDESVWFDHYFLPVVAPFFYIETLADLGKPAHGGRTPEAEVRMIADKFPDRNGSPCAHHVDAAFSNLFGHPIPMNGTVPMPGGRAVRVDGRTGVVWEEAPETKAFSRWQAQDFLSVERDFARQWRAALSSLAVDQVWEAMREIGIGGESSQRLAEAKAAADAAVYGGQKKTQLLELGLRFLGASSDESKAILRLWQRSGYPPLHEYAPYAAFVLDVEVFFQVSLAAGLIARERPSNRVDIAYLFYLPFCQIFVSNDKLHAKCAPLFLRDDQEFVGGEELKSDLRAINRCYLEARGADQDRDVWSFPHTPPKTAAPVISRLHRKYLGQRENGHRLDTGPEDERKLVEEVNRMHRAPGIPPDRVNFNVSEPDAIVVKRRVRRRKGSWLQIPKDVS